MKRTPVKWCCWSSRITFKQRNDGLPNTRIEEVHRLIEVCKVLELKWSGKVPLNMFHLKLLVKDIDVDAAKRTHIVMFIDPIHTSKRFRFNQEAVN